MAELVGMMTKEEMLEKVHDYEVAEPVDIELGNNVEFETDKENNITIDYKRAGKQERVTLTPSALSTLTANVGLTRAYLRRIPMEERQTLVLPHLNYWYRQALAGNVLRLLNVEDRAIMVVPKADFEHIRISDIIEGAERQLGDDHILGYHKFWSDHVAFYFSIVTRKSAEAIKDDTLFAGIRVRHSLLGEASTQVQAYVFRQWCSNGATTEDTIGAWRRRSNNEDLDSWFQKAIREADKSFDTEVGRLRQLAGISVEENTSDVLNAVLDQSLVPQGLQKEVRSRVIDRDPETLYDIYNILTEVDTHSDYFDKHQSSRGLLDRVASHLSRHSELCPVCHRQMN